MAQLGAIFITTVSFILAWISQGIKVAVALTILVSLAVVFSMIIENCRKDI